MKLLVHQHIYYHDQVDYIINKLSHIVDCDWDLYVTYSDYNEETEQKIKNFKSDAFFIKVKNVGYDIWPFIIVLRAVDLEKYNYVLKLHTKNFYKKEIIYNDLKTINYGWRNTLYDTYLYSKRIFKHNIARLTKNPNLGIIVNKNFFLQFGKYCNLNLPEETYLMDALKTRLGINSDYDKFVAGTMFMARADIFEKLRNSDIDEEDFSLESKTNITGSMAHVIERVFCILADDKGYKIDIVQSKSKHDKFFSRIFQFIILKIKNIRLFKFLGLN